MYTHINRCTCNNKPNQSTHSVSESDSPRIDRFLCGSGGVFCPGSCSRINTDLDLAFIIGLLLPLVFRGSEELLDFAGGGSLSAFEVSLGLEGFFCAIG